MVSVENQTVLIITPGSKLGKMVKSANFTQKNKILKLSLS
jgi:hypothetical protein